MNRGCRRWVRGIAWGFFGVACAAFALWVVSIFGHLWIARGPVHVGAYHGVLAVTTGHTNPTAQILAPADGSAAVRWRRYPAGLDWWFRTRFVGWAGIRQDSLPLWIPVIACGILSQLLFQVSRVRHAWACAKCGYDLWGLGNNATGPAVCPECGARTPRAQ